MWIRWPWFGSHNHASPTTINQPFPKLGMNEAWGLSRGLASVLYPLGKAYTGQTLLMRSFLRMLEYKANTDIYIEEKYKSKNTLKEKEVRMSHRRMKPERPSNKLGTRITNSQSCWGILNNAPVFQTWLVTRLCTLSYFLYNAKTLSGWPAVIWWYLCTLKDPNWYRISQLPLTHFVDILHIFSAGDLACFIDTSSSCFLDEKNGSENNYVNFRS